MSTNHARRFRVGFAVALAAVASWSLIGHGAAKDDPPANDLTPVTPLRPSVQGVSRCGTCHINGTPPESKTLKPLCRCNEETFWLHNDKHQDAYAVLLGKRAKQINAIRKSQLRPKGPGLPRLP